MKNQMELNVNNRDAVNVSLDDPRILNADAIKHNVHFNLDQQKAKFYNDRNTGIEYYNYTERFIFQEFKQDSNIIFKNDLDLCSFFYNIFSVRYAEQYFIDHYIHGTLLNYNSLVNTIMQDLKIN